MRVVGARGLFIVLLLTAVAGFGFGQVRMSLTAEGVASFQVRPTAGEVVASFATARQPFYWGVGYEVVMRHIGIGGIYAGDFTEGSVNDWRFDWYSEAIYVSYHLFARRRLIDPFVSLGLGCAGRVYLGPAQTPLPADSTLLLSIFPVASAGVGLDLSGLYLSLRLSYLPAISPPPATSFENVPIGRILAVASAGIALGR